MAAVVPVLKDPFKERAVPTVWRKTLVEIVDALVEGDYRLERCVADVPMLSEDTATSIANIISNYGVTLIRLPEAAWDSSVCQWISKDWQVLVDLYSKEEGPSDLVLHLNVREALDGYTFHVHLVYVP